VVPKYFENINIRMMWHTVLHEVKIHAISATLHVLSVYLHGQIYFQVSHQCYSWILWDLITDTWTVFEMLEIHSKKTSSHSSWIKRDQLDVTCFIISLFTAQHVSDVNIRHHNMCRNHYQKHTTHKENSITIRHRTNQHLQKHAFSNNHARHD